jgi:prepilin-type N-terminal cleavage/methylation domain-containing protein
LSIPKQAVSQTAQTGFTIVELLVVMAVTAIVMTSFSTFFTDYLTLYGGYQKDANNFSELAAQATRVGDVLRGITDINTESATDLDAYAYFAPTDTYPSEVHYYMNAGHTKLFVDVTPMTANAPIGVPIPASKKTYTIITNYSQQPGVNLFTYYDASGAAMTTPVADEHTIVSIGVTLAEPASHSTKGQQFAVSVSLRNRKTNL